MDKRAHITDAVAETLTRILDYLEDDEHRDFENSTPDARDNHVYLDVCFIRGWLTRALEEAQRPRPVFGSKYKGEV
jgi:hypothetical protein